jgi:hypothetical protein
MAISNPEVLLFAAFSRVTANNGPGKNTPERDISTTEAKNR